MSRRPSKSPRTERGREEREYIYLRPDQEVPAQPVRLPSLDDYDRAPARYS